mgnify:CR=1 FL=1
MEYVSFESSVIQDSSLTDNDNNNNNLLFESSVIQDSSLTGRFGRLGC